VDNKYFFGVEYSQIKPILQIKPLKIDSFIYFKYLKL